VQFVRPFTFLVDKLLLQATKDRLIGRLSLAVGLSVCHSSETSLVAQVTEIVCEFTGVKLPTVFKHYGVKNAKAGDNVSPNELLYFSGRYGDLDPFGEVVHRHEKLLALPRSLGKRPRTSIPHVANDKGLTTGIMVVEGTHLMGTNFWHLSQVRTSVIASSRKQGQ